MTTTKYSPHDLLPIAPPLYNTETPEFFYTNVVQYLIPDVLRIMNNGIPISMDKIKALDKHLMGIIADSDNIIHTTKLMQKFLAFRKKIKLKDKNTELELKAKTLQSFIKPYNPTNKEQRTVIINNYLTDTNRSEYLSDSWDLKSLKILNSIINSSFITQILQKTITSSNYYIEQGLLAQATAKYEIYQTSMQNKLSEYSNKLDAEEKFNPASSTQMRQLWTYLGLESEEKTPTGAMSIDRDEIERVQKLVINKLSVDETNQELLDVKELVDSFILLSNASIIKNNFIESFYKNSINSVLYGNLKLFGAKSFRLTSNNPNLLNTPSGGNIFCKQFKECLVAPKGYIIAAIDLSALEERMLANLSKDENKVNIFLKGIDS